VSPQDPHPVDLNPASGRLLDAANALRGWYGALGVAPAARVYAAHDALDALDDVAGLLDTARAQLLAEIRVDRIDRDAHTEQLLAETRQLLSDLHRERFGPPIPDAQLVPVVTGHPVSGPLGRAAHNGADPGWDYSREDAS
jgi:hypothetical protein